MSTIVEEHMLERNPEFAKLYQHLTTTILNPDGSTKNHPEVRERASTDKSLEKHRQRAIKHHLIEHAIRTTADPADSKPSPSPSPSPAKPLRASSHRLETRRSQLSSEPLPEPLLDLVLLLPPFLDAAHAMPPDSLTLLLLHPPLSDLQPLLPDLADLVSTSLHLAALGLARLTHPSTNPTFLHRHIASLPQDLADLKDRLATAQAALTTARLRTLTLLSEMLQTYSQCILFLVRSLEAKHGVIARNLELRATDISLQAQIADKSTELTLRKLRKQVYTADVVSALQNYAVHLKDSKARAADGIKALEAELERDGRVARSEGDDGRPERGAYEMDQGMGDLERRADRLRIVP